MAAKKPLTATQRTELVGVFARMQRSINDIAAHPYGRPLAEVLCARMAAGLELPTRSAQSNALRLLVQEIREAVEALEGGEKKETLQ